MALRTSKVPILIKFWVNRISKRDPILMAKMYSQRAILLATYKPLLLGRREILNYFVDFLDKEELKCVILENFTQEVAHTQISSGIYAFSFIENGKHETIKARYSFVIEDGVIINHHSSVVPK